MIEFGFLKLSVPAWSLAAGCGSMLGLADTSQGTALEAPGWALHVRSEPNPDPRQAPQSWPKGDFIDFVDFAVFLRILGQSSKCARKKYANLIRKMHPPKLGFLSDPLPSGPGGGHSTPVPTRFGHSMPVASHTLT